MHDFARNSSHRKRPQQKKPQKAVVSKKLIFITLLLAGGFLFGLYKLTGVKPSVNITPEVKPKIKTVTKPKPSSRKESKVLKDDYDFYAILPESEVNVPQVKAYISKKPSATDQKYNYFLQAGSFRSATEADKLRAKLLLQGLDAKTNRVTNSNGSIWYRAMVGPFSSRSKLNKAQDILAHANTESIVIKVKK
jgi:cell division protein FtsN